MKQKSGPGKAPAEQVQQLKVLFYSSLYERLTCSPRPIDCLQAIGSGKESIATPRIRKCRHASESVSWPCSSNCTTCFYRSVILPVCVGRET